MHVVHTRTDFAFLLLKPLQKAPTAASDFPDGRRLGDRWMRHKRVMWALVSLKQTVPMSLSAGVNFQPPTPVPFTPANFPPAPHLFPPVSSPPSSLPKRGSADSYILGRFRASWPCPRAVLASGLDRMDSDTVIHSRSPPTKAHRHVTNIYKLKPDSKDNYYATLRLLSFFLFSSTAEDLYVLFHPFSSLVQIQHFQHVVHNSLCSEKKMSFSKTD